MCRPFRGLMLRRIYIPTAYAVGYGVSSLAGLGRLALPGMEGIRCPKVKEGDLQNAENDSF
jgi:hypothetical protein